MNCYELNKLPGCVQLSMVFAVVHFCILSTCHLLLWLETRANRLLHGRHFPGSDLHNQVCTNRERKCLVSWFPQIKIRKQWGQTSADHEEDYGNSWVQHWCWAVICEMGNLEFESQSRIQIQINPDQHLFC